MAGGRTTSKSTKWSKTAKFLLYLATPFLLQMITILGLKLFIPPPPSPPPAHDKQGPEFQIYSASLPTFSTSWWSQTINASMNISLSAKNKLGNEKINHHFSVVSVVHNNSRLLWKIYNPAFFQVPGNDSVLDVNFPDLHINIDASVADIIRKKKRLSVEILILGTISNEDGDESKHWSKNFTAICKDLELQFFPSGKFLSRNQKAEMINEGPIKCASL